MSQYFKNESLDLGFLFKRILAHWYYFVISVPIVISLAFIYAKGLDRVYAFVASVIINTKRSGPVNPDELLDVIEGGGDRNINTSNEIGVLSSVTVIEQAMRKLDIGISYYMVKKFKTTELYKNAPFKVLLDSSAQQLLGVKYNITILSDKDFKISFESEQAKGYIPEKQEVTDYVWRGKFSKKHKFGEPLRKDFINMTIVRNEKYNVDSEAQYYFTINNLYEMAKAYKGKLKIKPLEKGSQILQLETQGTTARKEIDMLNSLMDIFIELNLYEKNIKGRKTLEFTKEQLKQATEDLLISQRQLEGYKTNKQLISIEDQTKLAVGSLERVRNDISALEIKLNYYKNIQSIINNDELLANAKIPATTNITDPTLSNLLNQFTSLHQQKVRLEISSGEKRTILQEVKTNMEVVRELMKDYVSSAISSFDIEMRSARQRLGEYRQNTDQLPQNQTVITDLEAKFAFNKARYEFLLKKKEEAEISLAISTPDIRVVDRARQVSNAPISPNTKFIYLMSLLVALGLPIGLIVIKDMINDRVRNKEELLEHTKIPLAGIIGSGGKSVKIVLLEQPRTLTAETIRTTRTNLDYLDENTQKVIGFTSALDFEGKTFCAVNIATAFALAGKRTLLICADLRKASIRNYFDIQEEGLSDFLLSYQPTSIRNYTIESVIQHTEIEGLDIMPAGKIVSNPSELLSSDLMEDLMSELKNRYHKIIIDTPPIGFVADYFTLSKFMDLTLYIVRANRTKYNSLEQINKLVEEEKLKNVKVILNDFKFSSSYEASYHKGGYA